MSGHTKGPWFRIPGRGAIWSDDRKTAIICGMHYNADNYEADANLIAAAPDLLACLAWMVRLYEQSASAGLVSGPEYCAALAVIAKARGEA